MAKRRRTRKRRGKISVEELHRGIYLDFEGPKDGAPELVGFTLRPEDGIGSVEQFVVSPHFEPVAVGSELRSRDLCPLIEDLVTQAETEDRRIISWSEHELKLVRALCPSVSSRFAARFKNARKHCETIRDATFPELRGESNALGYYMDFLEYTVPPELGPGRTGDNLSRLRRAMTAGKSWATLTDAQRNCWREVLGHNQHDCVGMYVVCATLTQR